MILIKKQLAKNMRKKPADKAFTQWNIIHIIHQIRVTFPH